MSDLLKQKKQEQTTVGVVMPVKLRDILQGRADGSYRSLSKYCAMVLANHVEQCRTSLDNEPVEPSATDVHDPELFLPDDC